MKPAMWFYKSNIYDTDSCMDREILLAHADLVLIYFSVLLHMCAVSVADWLQKCNVIRFFRSVVRGESA